MDNNSEDHVQNEDNEAGHVIAECLRNSVVLEIILEHFSSPELRQLSFVNKFWKSEAQSVLRKRGHLTAYVSANGFDQLNPRHEEVNNFISDLKQMNPVPFSGISIDIHFKPSFAPFSIAAVDPVEAVDPLEGVILNQPLLKTVSVKLTGSWWINMHSAGLLLTKKVLQDSSGVLEELALCTESRLEDFIEKVVQDLTFPRLKILKLTANKDRLYESGYENCMKTMLSRTPNLNVLHSDCPIDLMLSLLEGISVVPVYTSRVVAPFEEISENVMRAIKLENMELKHPGHSFNLERFNRITPLLLQASCTTTLHRMWIDPVLAVALMSYGIVLPNVEYLQLEMNLSQWDGDQGLRGIVGIVKNFDFSRIFPNLSKVEIVGSGIPTFTSRSHLREIIDQSNAVLIDPTPDRAAYIKTLRLQQLNVSTEVVQFFSEMFPNIENLNFRTSASYFQSIPFESIWKNWPDLKELKVRGKMLRTAAGNLDSVFCGIFPEEVAELRLKDEDYLKRVNIVPVMPATTCLKNLRTLSLNNVDPRNVPFEDDATFLVSKVTALLAFARQPALAVSLQVSYQKRYLARPVTTHLKPYVSITYEDLGVDWYRDD